jgi:hypothetical protein
MVVTDETLLSMKHNVTFVGQYMFIEDEATINAIGRDAGLEMWSDLTKEQQKDKRDNDREHRCFKGSFLTGPNNTPLLVYRGIGSWDPSIYTVNLKTGKPTKNSNCDHPPNKDLVAKLWVRNPHPLESVAWGDMKLS